MECKIILRCSPRIFLCSFLVGGVQEEVVQVSWGTKLSRIHRRTGVSSAADHIHSHPDSFWRQECEHFLPAEKFLCLLIFSACTSSPEVERVNKRCEPERNSD